MHFVVSMVMVWLAVQLVAAAGRRRRARRPAPCPGAVRGLIATSTAVLAALLVAGTLVTAAGPHAGDADTPRLDLPVPALAQLHADLLFAYLGMLVALGFTLHAVGAPAALPPPLPAARRGRGRPGRARRHPVRAGRAGGAGVAARARRRARDGRRRCAVGGHHRAATWGNRRCRAQRNWPPPGHDRGVRAIQITENGGPEVLNVVDLPAPEPEPGEVLVEVGAAGVNYIDTYHRGGVYPVDAADRARTRGRGPRHRRRGRRRPTWPSATGWPGRTRRAATPSTSPCPPTEPCRCPTPWTTSPRSARCCRA